MWDKIAKEAKRVWKADMKAWVEQDKIHGLCILHRKGHLLLPYVVARYNIEMGMFVESKSFTNWLESWVHFTARAEMDFNGEKDKR